ncbi:MAG: class II fumarate hydratase [Deltaproteobacteria bacterium]|nr:MAG: class II fumarate hydratase [Deltaproteobacteria bacterium]
MENQSFRVETDSMGQVMVPASAYYGAQTQRAVQNFPISGLRFPREFLRALGRIKRAAARVNLELGLLSKEVAEAIIQAAGEVVQGRFDDQFPVDIFQTGSGTSTNMNANEVIANRAIELLGGALGTKSPVHPNDHVNRGQSSNDVIPTAIHMAAGESVSTGLLPVLRECEVELAAKSEQFDHIIKIGRTHLQDATPVRLGQEFAGYARQVGLARERIEQVLPGIMELALGGTATGTGLNAPVGFASRVIALLADETGLPLQEAKDHFAAQGGQDATVAMSGALRGLAVVFSKVGNDLRWLSSGPRCGLGELQLPAVQPGSSIMPGKVNPVIIESLLQVAVQVMANDWAIALGGQAGNLELNVMLPVMAYNLLQSLELFKTGIGNLTERCLKGITANEHRCSELVEESLALCTPLAPEIGYDRAAHLAHLAYKSGKTVREIALELGILPEEKLVRLLDGAAMTRPGIPGRRGEKKEP